MDRPQSVESVFRRCRLRNHLVDFREDRFVAQLYLDERSSRERLKDFSGQVGSRPLVIGDTCPDQCANS